MQVKTGIKPGMHLTGTIKKYNGDGTITVSLNIPGLTQQNQEIKTFIPNSWMGTSGEFAGGYPKAGTTVKMVQGHAGQWHCLGYETDSSIFSSIGLSLNKLKDLKENRYLIKSNGNLRLFIEQDKFSVGNSVNSLDLSNDSISINLKQFLEFNQSHRIVSGEIKRDLSENSTRNLINSTLNSLDYDKSLKTIGLDPTFSPTIFTSGTSVRNPALTETRELQYEFAHQYNFTSFLNEYNSYQNDDSNIKKIFKNENRSLSLCLSLERPNYLIESIKGTVVDSFGNILDLNRSILPIGKIDELSLQNSSNKQDAFKSILANLRKSIAFHFEINSRKDIGDGLLSPDPKDNSDYARNRSKFFIDIDKEGQFKINVPASSETGNIPLLTRYENYSILLSSEDSSINPIDYVKPDDLQDIYLENFANSSIKLSSSESELDGYASPIDRFTEKPIKYGTAYHDITKTINESLNTANYLSSGMKLVNFDINNRLNRNFIPFNKIVSDKIIVSGSNANAGGRSGAINFDGFISLNIGANTIDRQSLWLDTAGSIIQRIGRDKNGISFASSFDGDVYLEVGGIGIGNTLDSRFSDQNDAYKNGTLDIKVHLNGQLAILRIAPDGIHIISPGTINLVSQQDIILKSNSNILMEAEQIVMYAESSKRIISRAPIGQTIG